MFGRGIPLCEQHGGIYHMLPAPGVEEDEMTQLAIRVSHLTTPVHLTIGDSIFTVDALRVITPCAFIVMVAPAAL